MGYPIYTILHTLYVYIYTSVVMSSIGENKLRLWVISYINNMHIAIVELVVKLKSW